MNFADHEYPEIHFAPISLVVPPSYKGLVTNYGEGRGATKREGGAREVLPLRKGGGERKKF